jgi:hypothetical protein
LDYRTFFGEAEEDLANFIEGLPAQLAKDLQKFKELAETDTFKDEETVEESAKTRVVKLLPELKHFKIV